MQFDAPSKARDLRDPQAGGIAIVVALILLGVMGAAAFSLSRNTIRELAISGTVIQGTKAESAADAGLDWFMLWAHPDNVTANAGSPTSLGHALLAYKMKDTLLGNYNAPFTISGNVANAEDTSSADDMTFGIGGISQGTAYGNKSLQAFDIRVTFLGDTSVNLTGGGGGASGGTTPQTQGYKELLWQVRSTGRVAIPGTGIQYQAVREVIATSAFSQQ